MSYRCEYCQSPCGDAETHCQNCGAPLTHAAPQGTDFRICPFCSHRLLALGSPACSYCGHRLPDEYIKAREADLNRLNQLEGDKKPPDPGSGLLADALTVRVTRTSSTLDILSDINNLFSRR